MNDTIEDFLQEQARETARRESAAAEEARQKREQERSDIERELVKLNEKMRGRITPSEQNRLYALSQQKRGELQALNASPPAPPAQPEEDDSELNALTSELRKIAGDPRQRARQKEILGKLSEIQRQKALSNQRPGGNQSVLWGAHGPIVEE